MKPLLLCFLLIPFYCWAGQPPCSDKRNPIILVHGFLSGGDSWSSQVKRLMLNGYCRERIFIFDWNTVGGNRQQTDSLLNVWVDSAISVCHSSRVDLIGHSAGGGLCSAYLSDSLHSLKVAHYIHIGSGPMKTAAGFKGNVPTMAISSRADKVLGALKDVPGIENIVLDEEDHAEVQTSNETFTHLYAFLNEGKPPAYSAAKRASRTTTISGRVVYFGDNAPVQTDSILLYYIHPDRGQRTTTQPAQIIRSDNMGYWPPVTLAEHGVVELEVHPPGGRVISYYFNPQSGDNELIYLRCIPPRGLISNIFKKLPDDSLQTVLAVFTPNQAIIAGRDSLLLDGVLLSTEELTPASKTVLACFIFDAGAGAAKPGPVKGFGTGVFLSGINKRISAGAATTQQLQFNNRSMTLPCRQSREALMVAIFR